MMASTRSIIRSVAQRVDPPGEVLEDRQRPAVPGDAAEDVRHLPVRGARAALRTARLRERRTQRPVPRAAIDCVDELKARGMPLGLHARLGLRGEGRHDRRRARSSCSRATASPRRTTPKARCSAARASSRSSRAHAASEDLRDDVLDALDAFTGPEWEQEDDITMVTLERVPRDAASDFEARRTVRHERDPRRLHDPERSRATSAWRCSASPRRSTSLEPRPDAAREGQDRGRRGDDERDRARQQERSGPPRR